VSGPDGSTLGWAISGVEDVDGDDVPDAIAGAISWSDGTGPVGATLVYSGRTGDEIHRFEGAAGSMLGFHVADAGDVDGDGVHDIVSGAPGVGPGSAFVYSGSTGVVLTTAVGEADGDAFGSAVGGVGDVDRDGWGDLVVGATAAGGTGRVYVVSGATGARLSAWEGPMEGSLFGSGLAPIGDLDGDGTPEVAVGAAGAENGGEVDVYDPTTGARVLGPLVGDENSVSIGQFFVGGLGDVDGDGVPDVYGGDFAGEGRSGAAWAWSGADGAVLLHLTGGRGSEGLGCGRGAGDMDGDGVPDLAVGSWGYDGDARDGGKVGLYSGVDGAAILTITNATAGENFGFDTVGLGDVDGDGRRDFLVSGATGNQLYLLSGPVVTTVPGDTGDTGDTAGDDSAGTPVVDDPEQGCGCAAPVGAASRIVAALVGLLALTRRVSCHPNQGRDPATRA
jgi:hypothetical protein